MKSYSKYLFVSFLALLFVPTSCNENLLDQTNSNTVSTGTFWANDNDVSLAVNGMYHPITNTFFWGRVVHTGALLRSDEFNVRPFGPNTAMSTLQGEAGAARWATEIWQEPFKTIFRANNVLENTNADNVPDEATRNGFIGQAHFMRGFANFYQLNLFGNIPLITATAKSSADFFPSQASQADVWASIEADFAAASAELPTEWDADNAGRPTSGAALAFLGKAQLYQGKWSEAAITLTSVIGLNRYELLPAAQYEDNFTQTNENNVESLYELQFLGQQNFAWGVDIPGTGNMGNFHIDYAPPTKSPDLSHYLNSWIKDLFESNGDEVRRNATLAYDYPGSTGYGGLPFMEDMAGDVELAVNDGVEAIFTRKYSGMDIGERDNVDFLGTNVGNNWRIIRYADVLLMAAEALNEDNNTSDAEILLNQVRERAMVDPKTGLSKDDLRQAIRDERVLELTGEGHRFFDLVRWGIAEDVMGATSIYDVHPKSLSQGTFETNKDEYIWIPASEISANENLNQNPGY